ncbi:MAG: trypsin-like peptidase domain-containing protein, partial [Planctomycetota bacterium]|nr:trypsin-like peptidase domain-containing protein [Planctomycetota bacterium]
ASLMEWNMCSAAFNGDQIVLELIAGPNTKASRIKVQTIIRGLFNRSPVPQSICGSADDRVRSFDKRQGRLWLGCTGWLIGEIAGGTRSLMLTAGHCTSSTNILELNVPLSTSSGTVVRSHPNDQYPYTVLAGLANGVGSDWQVASCGRNSNTNQLPTKANGGVWYNLGSVPSSPSGQNITITGYGSTSPRNNLSQVQKIHTGPLSRVNATSLCYTTDTSGGNSGSPIIHANTGNAIGIHTHGGCSSSGGCNSGTRIDRSDLQAALKAAGKRAGSFVTFGRGCKGGGNAPSYCASNNATGGTSSGTFATNEYAYTATATSSLNVVGFEIYSQSNAGSVTVNTAIYGSTAAGSPGALLASGTMTIGATAGFYKSSITASVPGGRFFVAVDHSASTTALSNLTSGSAGSGYWRRPPGSGAWSASGLLPFACYRVLCAGGGGGGAVPVIGNVGVPTINDTFSVTLSMGRPNSSAVLLTGPSKTIWAGGRLPWSLSVIGAVGCDLLIDPVFPIGIRLNGAGAGAIPISIPNAPPLVGLTGHHQWYVVDPGNNAANIAVSNGGTITIGG